VASLVRHHAGERHRRPGDQRPDRVSVPPAVRMIHCAVTEADAGPFTVESLRCDLLSLGLHPGDTVLCHVSLSRLGGLAVAGSHCSKPCGRASETRAPWWCPRSRRTSSIPPAGALDRYRHTGGSRFGLHYRSSGWAMRRCADRGDWARLRPWPVWSARSIGGGRREGADVGPAVVAAVHAVPPGGGDRPVPRRRIQLVTAVGAARR
jgi:hypothetical protein